MERPARGGRPWRCALLASAAAALLSAACVGGRPAPPIPQAVATPSYAPPSASVCAPAIPSAPYAWTSLVCPAADELTATRADFDALGHDAGRHDWVAAYSDAALLSQELLALRSKFDHIPDWGPGAPVAGAMDSAIDTYAEGVRRLNAAAMAHDVKAVPGGRKYLERGHAALAKAVAALRSMAGTAVSPAPIASGPAPATSDGPSPATTAGP